MMMLQCRTATTAESRNDSTTYTFERTVWWIPGPVSLTNNTGELGRLALGLWS